MISNKIRHLTASEDLAHYSEAEIVIGMGIAYHTTTTTTKSAVDRIHHSLKSLTVVESSVKSPDLSGELQHSFLLES